jgi:cytosine/adenosine deaminase-related metal-dependent hydrolase
MHKGSGIDRRRLLLTAASVPALSATEALAQTAPASDTQRGEFVIRNAHVLTMDPALGDFERGDVHVRAGIIVAVGPNLAAPGAREIDASKMIAMPGLIDTNNHLWNSLLRNLIREGPEKGYFATTLALGKQYTPEDIYHGVRLGVTEVLYSGVTTVQDWAHNLRSRAHADADLRALRDSGIRARFAYGTWQGGPPPDEQMDVADLTRMHRDWNALSGDGLLTLAVASRSIEASPRGAVSLSAIHKDWDVARNLGLPITMHTGAAGVIDILAREKLLGPDVQLINSTAWDDSDRQRVFEAKTHVTIATTSEMRYSYKLPQLLAMLKVGIKVSLSLDGSSVAGTCDLFSEMRTLMDTQFVRSGDPMSISARQVLEMATINGAWDLGLADITGSLTPGKRADLILVSTTDLNIAPLGDPVTAIVRSAQPHNVDTVIVDGRILKQGKKLTGTDPDQVVANAVASLAELKRKADWS